MAVRDDFAAGEVLAAADLNDTFASKLPYSYGTATPSTTDSGFLWYDSNSTPAAPKFWDGAAFQALTSGKILQIVRATDTTDRTTTSSTLVDANISVTITPTTTSSGIILIWQRMVGHGSGGYCSSAITDSSNNVLSGSQDDPFGAVTAINNGFSPVTSIAYDTPATTSATTYKGRFRSTSGTALLTNSANSTGQLFAIEVST